MARGAPSARGHERPRRGSHLLAILLLSSVRGAESGDVGAAQGRQGAFRRLSASMTQSDILQKMLEDAQAGSLPQEELLPEGPPVPAPTPEVDVPSGLPTTTEDPYPAVQGAACRGKEVEWGVCRDQPPCQICKRQDCEFADWSDWFELGGCTGLCVRDRAISVANNECGHPCSGPKRETRTGEECLPSGCVVPTRSCEWSNWDEWSPCGSNRHAQSFRTRSILIEPKGWGEPCEGPWNQTRPCAKDVAVDCQLSEWEEWTKCSSPCGGGWKARERIVARHSEQGGAPCENNTRETVTCNPQSCDVAKPCELSEWDSWTGCNLADRHQKFRTRQVLKGPSGSARQCDRVLRMTAPCMDDYPPDPTICGITHWTDWSACSATCGGQRFRARNVKLTTRSFCFVNTDFPLKEVTPCGSETCESEEDQCQLSPWSAWEPCSQSCGVGVATRSRTVAQPGAGCSSVLKEVKACLRAECEVTDCQWGDWDQWSGCSCSCGGGLHRRSRVIVASPRNGGKLCTPEEKHQVAPCATQPCDQCIDGEWGEWGAWSACSASCSPGQRVRHRSVGRPPNSCGKPVSGLEDEYAMCLEMPPCIPDIDCQLSEWEEWSACSQQCFGMRERRRRIVQFAAGAGRECLGPVTDVAPCNPGPSEPLPSECGLPPKRACQVAQWGEWTECSASCGRGQMKRERSVSAPSINGGAPCNATLSEVVHCEESSCRLGPCRDCRWGAWSDWGACSKCGGQRFRHRSIEDLPDHCGKKCDTRPAKEVGHCTSHCEDERYCIWSSWMDMSPCDGRCGHSSRLRSRQMTLVTEEPVPLPDFVGNGRCQDAQGVGYASYSAEVRSREECLTILKDLSDVPGVRGAQYHETDSSCRILIDGDTTARPPPNNVVLEQGEGGRGPIMSSFPEEPWKCWRLEQPFLFKGNRDAPCSGLQTQIAECPFVECESPCMKQDCVFSDWGQWTADCTQLCERSRAIVQFSSCGGRFCDGPLVETKICLTNCTQKQDCKLGDWSQWDPPQCQPPRQRARSRIVLQEPRHGGAGCEGVLEETSTCEVDVPQVLDCQVGLWSTWSACSRSCGPGLRMRSRLVAAEAANGGLPCAGNLEELQSCILGICPTIETDGQLAQWSPWSACTDALLMFRHRNVTVEPRDGGQPVQGPVLEASVCSSVVDCIVSDWTPWSRCDKTCGGGQQHRHRQVTRNPQNGGAECVPGLQEVRGCSHSPCQVVDCQVSDWSEWSQCSSSCGVGQRSRNRYIDHLAEPGGTGCNLNLSEAQACAGDDCEPPTDCEWGAWGEWDACSCDCDGGERMRTREVATMPTKGGKPCAPLTKEEVIPCNTQPCHVQDCVDGLWGDWQPWGECSASCEGGVTSRSRSVTQEANHCGRPAVGLRVQHASCNVDKPCEASVDCQFSQWSSWSTCASMADACVGRQQRNRQFLQHGRGDGRFCMGAMKEEQACTPPEAFGCEAKDPVDCVLGPWGEWEPCDTPCGPGQTVRQRSVVTPQLNGGLACENALQVTKQCQGEAAECSAACEKQDCVWSQWSEWSSCTKCGGQKVRSRHVAKQAMCRGLPCEPGAAEEVADCPRQCHALQYCIWADWSDWDACVQDCGESMRKRERQLRRVSVKPTDIPGLPGEGLENLERKFEQLHKRAEDVKARRLRELTGCFFAGCLSLLGLMTFVRTCSRTHCLTIQERLYAAAPSVAIQSLRAVSREQVHGYRVVGEGFGEALEPDSDEEGQ